MEQDLTFQILGNSSPFSTSGKSSCYMVTVDKNSYLLECGSPVFSLLGIKKIGEIKGVFGTHSHEDHKRWFTDMVLCNFYSTNMKNRLKLISSETVLEEFQKNSKGALERSLSMDSKRIVNIPYKAMVEEVLIGPRSRFFINLNRLEDDSLKYFVEDREGNIIGPDRAKIFINPEANRPRLLFKDFENGKWVEPESYYPFSSSAFYEDDKNVFHDDETGLKVTAVKSYAWHGVPTIALKFEIGKNRLFFSSDTVYKPSLWKELSEAYIPQKFDRITKSQFEESSILYGDINDFIEVLWSKERYDCAINACKGSKVIHDIAKKNSVVHTDYPDIANSDIADLFFTHCPDNLTSLRPVLTPSKKLVFSNGNVFESVKGKLYPFDADVYIHHFSGDMVGYRSEHGKFKVIEKDGLLGVVTRDSPEKGFMDINIYEDIDGEYFPKFNSSGKSYRKREDGKVEEVIYNESGSIGRVVENLRGNLPD